MVAIASVIMAARQSVWRSAKVELFYLLGQQKKMKRLVFLVSATILPGAATAWLYETKQDDAIGRPYKVASAISENTHALRFPYSGGTYGSLALRSHPRFGVDVIFSISNGQIRCSPGACNVLIRVDDKPGFSVSGSEPSDGSSDAVFLPASVIKRLQKSRRAVITVTIFREGDRSFVFDAAGLKWP